MNRREALRAIALGTIAVATAPELVIEPVRQVIVFAPPAPEVYEAYVSDGLQRMIDAINRMVETLEEQARLCPEVWNPQPDAGEVLMRHAGFQPEGPDDTGCPLHLLSPAT